MTERIAIASMWGLGDNMFQRPFVEELTRRGCHIWIDSPWPEIYADLPNVALVRSHRNLRTQLKNQARQPESTWTSAPAGVASRRIWYSMGTASLPEEMAAAFGMGSHVPVMSMPPTPPWPRENDKPICVIRPCTLRKEWLNPARNPRPEYVAQAAAMLMDTHHVIAVADLEDGSEWLDGEPPPSHQQFLHGELGTNQLMALTKAADLLVGGTGWIIPFAVAAQRRAIIINGGQGGHSAPEKVTHPKWQQQLSHQITWITPAPFCRCTDMGHRCSKEISDFSARFEAALAQRRSAGTTTTASAITP